MKKVLTIALWLTAITLLLAVSWLFIDESLGWMIVLVPYSLLLTVVMFAIYLILVFTSSLFGWPKEDDE